MNDHYREAVSRLLDQLLKHKDMAKIKPNRLPLLAQFMLEELAHPKTRSQTIKFLLEFVAGKTLAVPPSIMKSDNNIVVTFDDTQDSLQTELTTSN